MFKRLYAIGAHEDFFSPPTRRTRFSPRFGTTSTKAWYRQYHTVVLRVPHRGIPTNRNSFFVFKDFAPKDYFAFIFGNATKNH